MRNQTMKKISLILFVCAFVLTSCDKEKRELRKGNEHFANSAFGEADTAFRSALTADSLYEKAYYNLASASYKQKSEEKLHSSAKYYEQFLAGLSQNDTLQRSNTIYNIGNANFQLSQTDSAKAGGQSELYLRKSAEQYKQTLRLNPSDTSAKHNLALVQHLLKQYEDENKNQNQQQQQQSDNQQQQDKNSSPQNSKSDNQKQENGSQGGEEKQQEGDKSDAQVRKRNQKETERMLEALKNNEKQTLGKIKRQENESAQKRHIEKDW